MNSYRITEGSRSVYDIEKPKYTYYKLRQKKKMSMSEMYSSNVIQIWQLVNIIYYF